MAAQQPRSRQRPIIDQHKNYLDSRRRSYSSCSSPSIASFSASSSPDLDDISYASLSTAPTSYNSPKVLRRKDNFESMLPTGTYTISSSSSTSSINTYDSLLSAEEGDEVFESNAEHLGNPHHGPPPATSTDGIPAALPAYRALVVDPSVRPSDPQSFSRLFPSLDRLSIHHDDLTADGNMNLRVDTVIPNSNRRNGPVTVQLFHLRMFDLARRDFSLRRYCRESGREVCNSKRAYVEGRPPTRPGLQRSVSSAMRSVKIPFQRASHVSTSHGSRPPTAGGSSVASHRSHGDNASIRSIASSTGSHSPLVPTDSTKLEFTNYARVDVTRNGNKAYGFEWWGHEYTWRRVVDKTLDSVSFHLVRDGHGDAVAHIVPENRSPNQLHNDEVAGGWVPPCHMWISDNSIVDAVTDVAE